MKEVDDMPLKMLLKELRSLAWRMSNEHDSPYSAAIVRKAARLLETHKMK